jgi:hypothetical protein
MRYLKRVTGALVSRKILTSTLNALIKNTQYSKIILESVYSIQLKCNNLINTIFMQYFFSNSLTTAS